MGVFLGPLPVNSNHRDRSPICGAGMKQNKSVILRYFTLVFPFSATLYFPSTTFIQQRRY